MGRPTEHLKLNTWSHVLEYYHRSNSHYGRGPRNGSAKIFCWCVNDEFGHFYCFVDAPDREEAQRIVNEFNPKFSVFGHGIGRE